MPEMMMEGGKCDWGEVRSPCSASSPKTKCYTVLSPPSSQGSPASNSPMDSPMHSSTLASSSGSRVSGIYRKFNRKRGWPECDNRPQREHVYFNHEFARRCRWALGLIALFSMFCFFLWSASRPYKPQVVLESLTVNSFSFGQGSDYSGVPTKLVTVNCSLELIIFNPATFFGIHISSTPLHLYYSDLTVATGQLREYYQPRMSLRIMYVNLQGNNVPLYGAGPSISALSDADGGIPLRLEFGFRSRGHLVGKLVKTKYQKHISCSLVVDSTTTNSIKFKEDSCTYG